MYQGVVEVNSVTINTANDTKIVGAEIANVRGGIDYGNLTLNTKSLTFENLQNHNNSESNSFGINLSLGIKPTDPTAPQNSQAALEAARKKEGVVPGNLGLNLSMQGSESSSTTNATIGKGTININGSTATADQTANLNRDINNTEQNKKTVITSDFESTLNIDTRYLAAAYYATTGDSTKAGNNLGSVWGDAKKGWEITYEFTPIGVNKAIEKERGSDQTLAWGDPAVYKSGTEENGVFDPDANNVGIGNVADPTKGQVVGQPVKFATIVDRIESGNEGSLMSLVCNYGLPGCNDMSKTHDNWGGSDFIKNTKYMLQLSIPPAYIYNTYGLIGKPINTVIDYIDRSDKTINLVPISIPVPTINQTFQRQ
jgi:hypothetical protein